MAHFKKFICLLIVVTLTLFSTACEKTGDATSKSTDDSFSSYAGIWSESDLSWDFSGLTLEISSENEEALFDCRLTQSAPHSRVAQFTKSVKTSEIKNNSIIIDYQDDGFGNSGTAEITFVKDYILVDFTNLGTENSVAQWGFYESTYKLWKNDNAYKLLEYNMDDYEEKYSEDDSNDDTVYYDPPQQQVTQQPMFTFPANNTQNSTYDTSKASGILASMGMTEAEFKASCTPLRGHNNSGYYNLKAKNLSKLDEYDLNYGKQYFDSNPTDEAFIKAKKQWEKICNEYPDWKDPDIYYLGSNIHKTWYEIEGTGKRIHVYEKYGNWETYLNEQIYAKEGHRLLNEYTEELFRKMREYPNDYIGQCFMLLDADSFYENYYEGISISVDDVRDDTSNPNILFSEYDYYLYVIFTGSSGSTLDFDLIAIEKTREN